MTMELLVPEISCQHCVNAITSEVSQLEGVQNVTVDLGSKHVRVDATAQVTSDAVVAAVNEAGYDEVTVLNA
jgi:copper ion binding protein